MPRTRRKSKSMAVKSAELAFAVPQVVAHRLTRMALGSTVPSKRDRKEFSTMISEKQIAFSQAWTAMAAETFRLNQSIAASLFGSFVFPGHGTKASSMSLSRKMQGAASAIVSKGLAPVHRTAVANAKRLGRSKAR